MGSVTETGSLYSRPVGFIFVFNLIVGAGVLAMPKAFGDAGWLAGAIFLVILGFFSFVTSTFMVEVMAAGNAWLRVGNQNSGDDDSEDINAHPLTSSILSEGDDDDDDSMTDSKESDPLVDQGTVQVKGQKAFQMKDRIEMGQLANFFFNRVGIVLYYLCIVVYLYGDLSIYAVAIPKAFAAVICKNSTSMNPDSSNSTNWTSLNTTTTTPANMTSVNVTNSSGEECFGTHTIMQKQAYYIFLIAFTLLLGPFVFFNVQKTKYLQITTSITRYIALGMMVWIALEGILREGKHVTPTAFKITHIPNLFGALVYSFMCQHSLPSMITPISKKKGLTVLLGLDFITAAVFYALITFTAISRFDNIDDEYSNNFTPDVAATVPSYYIRLFPVFTLSTSFPIIGVTLRNNLKLLFHRDGREFPFVIDRIFFPLAALLPPVALAFATENLELLVGITGSYAGVGVQYVVPAMLVWCARRKMTQAGHYNNPHRSVFGSNKWVYIVCVWAVASWIMVTANNIVSHV